MNSSASAAAPVQHKRRAVLKDVTNVCCENSYKNCLIAAKIPVRNFRFHCGLVYVSEPGYMLFRAGVPWHAIIKKFGEKDGEREKLLDGASADIQPRRRTPEEIMATYRKAGDASSAAGQARNKLLEPQEKLESEHDGSDVQVHLNVEYHYEADQFGSLTRLDVFQLVGAPLVENCLAGFNSSVFAYGQGLTPLVFERLFGRIDEEQIKHADKQQLMYQCRCSFLEIYNEQITDLLDPSQRNLQIREDVKSGVYVENLTEECVSTMKDVTQLLIKGLSNRRTGATSINAESSRSHSVFTCVVEPRYKSVANGLSCFKTSRINLVDLAGSERQKLTGAAGERLKEAGNINRSLSQLGFEIRVSESVGKAINNSSCWNDIRSEQLECLISVFQIGVACSAEVPQNRMDTQQILRELLSVRVKYLGI
ncbi:Kinesin-like protein KIN-12A [Camellia lanceoleosa]|nr:Kinesin-like protein KIN-12A [Camellia lanceoleosa]